MYGGHTVVEKQNVRSQKTDSSGIAALDAALPGFRLLGPAGFIFAANVTARGPELYHSEYPMPWQIEYESRTYAYFDPVVLWGLMNVGNRRWSEITLPDLRGVMKAAVAHGLNFGCVFARVERGRRSMLTLARSDRECTDEEIAFLAASFEQLVSAIMHEDRSSLTPVEIETLRCIRDGMSFAEAAALLNIAVPTVKARVDRARGKLGARNATQTVALALQRNLI